MGGGSAGDLLMETGIVFHGATLFGGATAQEIGTAQMMQPCDIGQGHRLREDGIEFLRMGQCRAVFDFVAVVAGEEGSGIAVLASDCG